MKLYQTYVEIETLWDTIEGILTGDITQGPDGLPVDPDIALDWMEEALKKIEGERDTKALNIACMVKNFRAEAEALKAETNRLAKRQQAAERTIDRLTTYLSTFIEPGLKLRDSRATIGWRKSEGVKFTADPKSLPTEFQRIKVEANLSAIKEALQSGEEIDGAVIEKRQNIQIK